MYQNKFEHLECELKGHVLWVTLNQPDKRNAISLSMAHSLVEVLQYADFDKDVRVIVLTGKGECFSAGGDVKAMATKTGMFEGEANELRLQYIKGLQRIPLAIEALSTPIIALVNGHAIGAGCDLSFMCDIRIAHKDVKFGETFSKLGLVPGVGGTYFLQRLVGYGKAMEIFLTGKIFSAQQAYDWGALQILTASKDESMEKLLELIDQLLENSPIAQGFTKSALKMGSHMDLKAHLEVLAAYQGIAQRTNDHFEGLKALEEKRKPNFNFS
jgi:2-(1,2-epoxy-1,2-dihydrophenyl)acetyl-CoA isomerase